MTRTRHARRRPRCAVRRTTRRGGYTLIEVMMAVGIMTVGAVGIMALQQATTRGNATARRVSVATAATSSWLERAKRDSTLWRQPDAAGLATTQYLVNAPAAVGTAGTWFTPTGATLPAESPITGYHGRPTTSFDNSSYCTQMRLDWVMGQSSLRVEVRTWWHRFSTRSSTAPIGSCAGSEGAVTAQLVSPNPSIRAVFGSTVVRRNAP